MSAPLPREGPGEGASTGAMRDASPAPGTRDALALRQLLQTTLRGPIDDEGGPSAPPGSVRTDVPAGAERDCVPRGASPDGPTEGEQGPGGPLPDADPSSNRPPDLPPDPPPDRQPGTQPDTQRSETAGARTDAEARLARSGLVSAAIGTVLAVLVVLALFALAVPLSGAVLVPGRLAAEGERVTVQASQPGVVASVLVAENALVEKGQPLLVLANEASTVERDRAAGRLARLGAVTRRLELELRTSHDPSAPDAALPATAARLRGDPLGTTGLGFDDVQADILRTRLASQARERDLREATLRRAREARAAVATQRELRGERVARAEAHLERMRDALDAGVVTRREVELAERERDDQRDAYVGLEVRAAEASRAVLDAEHALARAETEFRERALGELAELRERSTDLESDARIAGDAAGRLIVRAPVSGHVQMLRVRAKGHVVRGADPLLEIVPSAAPLVAIARVSPADIDAVREGDAVELRLLGLDPRSPPVIAGRIAGVSRDLVRGERPDVPDAYEVTASFDPAAIDTAMRARLRPGLVAQFTILGTERTLADYLLAPLLRGLEGAMRER